MENQIDFELSNNEMEILRHAALDRSLPFDSEKRIYSNAELKNFGMVREGYNMKEMDSLGFKPGIVTSFDKSVELAKTELRVETPFANNIVKWQLPLFWGLKFHMTHFPPNTVVHSHKHPDIPFFHEEGPAGGLRIVIAGKIIFEGKEFFPGDWFFVPNGIPYSFRTDSEGADEAYGYGGGSCRVEVRFSPPIAVNLSPDKVRDEPNT